MKGAKAFTMYGKTHARAMRRHHLPPMLPRLLQVFA
jgi:hypothetical protein